MSDFEGGAPAPQSEVASSKLSALVQSLMGRMMQPQLGAPPGMPQAPMPGQGGGVRGEGGSQIIQGREGNRGPAAFQAEMGQQAANSVMRGVQTAVQMHKQKQLNEATAMWMTLQAAHDRLSLAGKVGQDGVVDLMQDPLAAAILQDPKKMKNMAKAFQTDMLNPEKTNVYAEGLKKAMKMDHAGKMVRMLRSLKMAHQPQPQLDPSQLQQMGGQLGRNISGMARPQGMNPRLIGDFLKEQTEEMKQAELDKRLNVRETGQDTRQDKKLKADQEKQDKSLKQQYGEFSKTLDFKRWNAMLMARTRIQAAKLASGKPSQALQPIAVFARTGVGQFEKAQDILEKLQSKGVLGTWLQGKVQDAIWGSGLVDPSIPPDVRKDIGELRGAIQLGNSAMLRAHTGRTSKEIYDDIRGMNKLGQDIDALYGAVDNSIDVLTEYANVLTPEAQSDLKKDIRTLPRSGGGKTKPSSGKVINNINELP